jgi:hypothetical protein
MGLVIKASPRRLGGFQTQALGLPRLCRVWRRLRRQGISCPPHAWEKVVRARKRGSCAREGNAHAEKRAREGIARRTYTYPASAASRFHVIWERRGGERQESGGEKRAARIWKPPPPACLDLPPARLNLRPRPSTLRFMTTQTSTHYPPSTPSSALPLGQRFTT